MTYVRPIRVLLEDVEYFVVVCGLSLWGAITPQNNADGSTHALRIPKQRGLVTLQELFGQVRQNSEQVLH